MFGTIILDAYEFDQRQQMADKIEEICSPLDTYGWASAGLYSFWDYNTKEIYYIGLAADLSERFQQHNGIILIDSAACKWKNIQHYFTDHKKLGYTIFVQSPLSQPITHRNEHLYREWLNQPRGVPIENYVGEEGLDNIRLAEGQLIEAYNRGVGQLPAWNKIGGNIHGQKSATVNNYYQIVNYFSKVETDNYLVSRSTITELASNATYEWFENQLHGLRMMMLIMGMSFKEAIDTQLKLNPYFRDQWNRIIETGYLDKKLIV